ncbi:MAG: hypothetical protein ACLPYS_05045 [Vulcanimicrobiaceae bacterium]
MGPPMLAALALNLLVFLWLFRNQVRGKYRVEPAPGLQARAKRTLAAMLAVAAAYVGALLAGWPLGPVALAGALVVLTAGGVGPRQIGERIGWWPRFGRGERSRGHAPVGGRTSRRLRTAFRRSRRALRDRSRVRASARGAPYMKLR